MSETMTIIGNLGDEPQSRGAAGGVPIAGFSVCTTQRRMNRETGQWEDAGTTWYRVSAYRQLAQHVLGSLHKGERVIVHGRFKLREWDNGTKKGVSAEIDADGVGHDLLWGTSAFRRDGQQRQAPPADASWDTAAIPPSVPDGAWAPGLGMTPEEGGAPTDAQPVSSPPREPVLAGVDDTPF